MTETKAELEALRARNRRALGLADFAQDPGFQAGFAAGRVLGMAGAVPGGVGGVFPDLLDLTGTRIVAGSAFPDVEYVYEPGQPAEGDGTAAAEWFNKHVVRPYVEVQNAGGTIMRYAPGDGAADFSGVAKALALGVVVLGTGFAAWTMARAFLPRGVLA